MPHWKKAFNPNYLGGYAFEPGEIMTATIKSVVTETVMGTDGKNEQCLVLHFSEQSIKPMILNKTNCKTISKLVGSPDTDKWVGHKIKIGTEKVRAFGEITDALRVRPERVKDEPPIICAGCGKRIESAYGMTPSQLAAYTEKKFGQKICAVCANSKRTQTEKEAEKRTEERTEERTEKETEVENNGNGTD